MGATTNGQAPAAGKGGQAPAPQGQQQQAAQFDRYQAARLPAQPITNAPPGVRPQQPAPQQPPGQFGKGGGNMPPMGANDQAWLGGWQQNPNPWAQGGNWAGGSQYAPSGWGKGGAPMPPMGPGQNGHMGPGVGEAPPAAPAAPQSPIDFAAGFDPSKSIWGENGRKAYMADKANEFFRNQASGSALFDQWQQIHQQNPLAARAFRQAVQGRGGGQNDFEQQLLQRGFGGDVAKWNEYRNAAHGAGQEGLESGFDLITGKWDPMNANHGPYQVQGWNPAAFSR